MTDAKPANEPNAPVITAISPNAPPIAANPRPISSQESEANFWSDSANTGSSPITSVIAVDANSDLNPAILPRTPIATTSSANAAPIAPDALPISSQDISANRLNDSERDAKLLTTIARESAPTKALTPANRCKKPIAITSSARAAPIPTAASLIWSQVISEKVLNASPKILHDWAMTNMAAMVDAFILTPFRIRSATPISIIDAPRPIRPRASSSQPSPANEPTASPKILMDSAITSMATLSFGVISAAFILSMNRPSSSIKIASPPNPAPSCSIGRAPNVTHASAITLTAPARISIDVAEESISFESLPLNARTKLDMPDIKILVNAKIPITP